MQDLRQTSPGEPAVEAAQIQLSGCAGPSPPRHGLALDLTQPQLGKGQGLGLHLSRAVDIDTGGPSVRLQHTGLACCSRPFLWGKAYAQGKWSLIGSDFQASATTTRQQTVTLKGQQNPESRRKSCLILCTGLDTTIPTTPPIKMSAPVFL